MRNLIAELNWPRLCIASFIFVAIFVARWEFIELIFSMFPTYNALFWYLVGFTSYFLAIFSGAMFYFWTNDITFLRSLYLGIAFAVALYLFEIIYNWLHVEYRDGLPVYWSYVSIVEGIIIVIGTTIVASIVQFLSPLLSSGGREMRTF